MGLILVKTAKQKVIEKSIKLLQMLKDDLKENKIFKDMVKDFGHDLDILDGVSIEFSDDIDTTAKTVNGKVYLNMKLINAEPSKILRYLVHEMVHVFQHMKNEGKKQDSKGDYLKMPDEVEAFTYQLKHQEKNESSAKDTREGDDVVSYLKNLMKYHKVPKKEQEDILKDLTEDLSDPKSVINEVLDD